jgi:hypothetical protein
LGHDVRSRRFWLWPNLLSLDAPLVAVLWQVLFVRCLRTEAETRADLLPAVLLVAAVWLIYTADRALDAWRGADHRPRHEFYRRHWRAVLPVWMAVLGVTGWLASTTLSAALFERGAWLLAAVILYLAAVHALPLRLAILKEAMVAVLFALGATLAAWAHVRTFADILTVVFFSFLCWMNCAAIERWESDAEESGSRRWSVGVFAACLGLAVILCLHQQRPILGAAETASAFAFVLLDRSRMRLSADALRVLADVALLSPVFFLPLVGIPV